MAVPNNMQKYIYLVFDLILDISNDYDWEIVIENGNVIFGNCILWCFGKHGRYDRSKNQIERTIRRLGNRGFNGTDLNCILYANMDELCESFICIDDKRTCKDCKILYVCLKLDVINKVSMFCLHNRDILLDQIR